jgi:hypothetical protein
LFPFFFPGFFFWFCFALGKKKNLEEFIFKDPGYGSSEHVGWPRMRNCCSYSTLASTSCNSNEFSGLSVYSCHKLGSAFVAGDLENFRKMKSQLKHGQRHPRHSRKPEMR